VGGQKENVMFKYTQLQLSRLLALAGAHGHWWAPALLGPGDRAEGWSEEGPRPQYIDRPGGWTPEEVDALRGAIGGPDDMGGVPAPTPDSLGRCGHTTATGRLQWWVAPDGATRIAAWRAHPSVQQALEASREASDREEKARAAVQVAREALAGPAWWNTPGMGCGVGQEAHPDLLAPLAAYDAAQREAYRAAAHLEAVRGQDLPPVMVLLGVISPDGALRDFQVPEGVGAVSAGAASAFVDAIRVVSEGAELGLPPWLRAFAGWYSTPVGEGEVKPPKPGVYLQALACDPRTPVTPPPPKVALDKRPVPRV
jgi:hypothetical protein